MPGPSSPLLSVNQGVDHSFFKVITVTSSTFGSSCDVILPFKGIITLSLQLEGSNVLEGSFNGTQLHFNQTSGKASATLLYTGRRVSKIWFRVPGGSTVVRVEAWS